MRRRLLCIAAAAYLTAGTAWAAAPSAKAPPILTRAPGPFLEEPYLIFTGVPDKMEVLWQLDAGAPAVLSWGPDTTCALGSVVSAGRAPDHRHTVTIPGLTPGARYHYRVTAEGVDHGGTFTAAPDPSARDLKFLVYGDTRSFPQDHSRVAAAMVSRFTSDPAWQTLVVAVGDLCSDGDLETAWTSEFFTPSFPAIRRLMAAMPYQSCIGNHDGDGALFATHFPYPYASARYWSFDYGPAHFVMMDQYVGATPGSVQLRWLERDLAASKKPWKFICLHEPGWSAGGHDNDAWVQTYVQPLCRRYGVAIVFGGHNHYYARAVVDGIQHVTTGGGGAPLYEPDPSTPLVVAAARAYHFCEIEIAGRTLDFRAVTPEGAVIDRFTHSLDTAAPPVLQPAF